MPRQEEVSVGLVFVTSHPAPQLVEIAQAEPVGAINDDGVGVGNIEAAFNDRRGEQDISLAIDEPGHHLLQVIAVHLAMADDDSRVGEQRLELLGHRLDGHDAVVQEKDLAAPVQLALNGIADDTLVVLSDDGFDRQPVLRRRLDGAHVTGAGERKVKSPWNRRGAQGQHVHQLAQQLELLLLHHAEALFLVDDDQRQVFERDIVLDQAVRADDDVHRPGCQVADYLLLLAPCPKTGEQLDAHRVIGHPLAERVKMLLGEHGRGHQHRHLPAVHHRLERGANGHFGLAESDVAANQPVHRLGLFHVGFGFHNGAHLVGCFLVDKGALKLALPRRVGRKGMARLRFARRLEGEQFGGQIAHGLFRLRLRFGPARAAEGVERRTDLACADVFADQVCLGDRHVEFGRRLVRIRRRIFDDEAFLGGVTFELPGWAQGDATLSSRAQRQDLQTEISPDAVLDVNDIITLFEFAEIDVECRAHRRGVRRFQAARPLHLVPAEDFSVGDDDQPAFGEDKSASESAEVKNGVGAQSAVALGERCLCWTRLL